jgi:Phage tail assembly chaperone protein
MFLSYTDVVNPRWGNAEQTELIVDVNFNHLREELVPFNAAPHDCTEHGPKIYADVMAGMYGSIAAFVPASEQVGFWQTDDVIEQMMREKRGALLQATDWTQLPDVPQTMKGPYASFRQALRDVPSQSGFPRYIEWPPLPE